MSAREPHLNETSFRTSEALTFNLRISLVVFRRGGKTLASYIIGRKDDGLKPSELRTSNRIFVLQILQRVSSEDEFLSR